MTIVAAVRPDSWDFPLLVHVLGAMILVGGLSRGRELARLCAWRRQVLRLGYWSLLAVALPGWLVMRIGAEWIASREGWNHEGVHSRPGSTSGSSSPTPAGSILSSR